MNSNPISKSHNDHWCFQFKAFLFNALVIFLIYRTLLQTHFSPDTFAEYVNEETQYLWHISNGRPVYALLHRLLYVLDLRVTVYASAYTFIFMLVCAWCVMRAASALCGADAKSFKGVFYLCDLAMLISIVNISVLEWYLFPECMLMYTLALLGATEGAAIFAKKDVPLLRRILISFVCLFIAINSYQAILGWYIALALMIILVQTDFCLNLRAFGLGCAVIAVGGADAILNQFIVRLALMLGVIENSSRQAVISSQELMLKLRAIFDSQKDFLKNGYYLLPDYFLFGALALGIALLFFALGKKRLIRFFSIGVALGSGYILTLLPHLLSSSIRIAPRTLPAIFAILSLLLISSILCGGTTIRRLACLFSILVLLVSSQSISAIIADHMTTIRLDVAEGHAILHEIEAHETESLTEIKEICMLPDTQMQFCHPGVTTMWMDINPRHMTVEWEREPFLETLSGRDFAFIMPDEQEAEAIIQGKNWDAPDYDEQILFDGHRVYVILY